MLPRSGDVVHLTNEASVQFGMNPIFFRVIRTHDWDTYDGWIWLDGYELNKQGDAVERRSVFVQIAGLRAVGNAPDPGARRSNSRMPGVAPGQRPARELAARRNTATPHQPQRRRA